jgi:hypothetical protein
VSNVSQPLLVPPDEVLGRVLTTAGAVVAEAAGCVDGDTGGTPFEPASTLS